MICMDIVTYYDIHIIYHGDRKKEGQPLDEILYSRFLVLIIPPITTFLLLLIYVFTSSILHLTQGLNLYKTSPLYCMWLLVERFILDVWNGVYFLLRSFIVAIAIFMITNVTIFMIYFFTIRAPLFLLLTKKATDSKNNIIILTYENEEQT